ncbi:MAG: di-heme-cytochrome C peroxidase, partial [Acidobacteriaceae bacterium]
KQQRLVDRVSNEVLAHESNLKQNLLRTHSRLRQESMPDTHLDALNRIGNAVFAIDLKNPANFVGTSAPVHFPRIWNASWFEWVQYNGAIQQPMTRNAGEALGVFAQVNLTDGSHDLFSSRVQVKTLYEIEQLLAGTQPPDAQSGFSGLASPKWPANVLPPINADLAAKGAVLYKNLCQGCHMPPVTDAEFWTSARWLPPNSAGERYLNLKQIDIKHIGTDPAQAEDMKNRRVVTPRSLEITSDEFGAALGQVVELTLNHWYNSQRPPISEALREQMNGHRPNGIRAPLSYKVRPLNGIWATPPYLHNGSVPNLYALLSPVQGRPRKFYLGNREYDPVNVGYRVDKFPGAFVFDTTIRGNSNAGHEFTNNPNKPGVIGRQLTPDERRALIEYLKTF